jgi:hypothetical protein
MGGNMTYTYTPEDMPEVTLEYEFIPGQAGSFDQPGYPDEVEIFDIKIHGRLVSDRLTELMYDVYSGTWEREIIRHIKQEQANERAGI